MKTAFVMIFLLLAGPGLLWTGIQSLRRGQWRDGVPLLEIAIDHAAGVEPPPRTTWDHRFALSHTIFCVIFGAFFSLCLATGLISTFSE